MTGLAVALTALASVVSSSVAGLPSLPSAARQLTRTTPSPIAVVNVSGAAQAVPGPKLAVNVVVGSEKPGTKSSCAEKSKLPTARGAPAVSRMFSLSC